jgi:hypothetical protein
MIPFERIGPPFVGKHGAAGQRFEKGNYGLFFLQCELKLLRLTGRAQPIFFPKE